MVTALELEQTLDRPLTIDDFELLPEDDGNRYELIGGDLCVSPAPSIEHQLILSRLVGALQA